MTQQVKIYPQQDWVIVNAKKGEKTSSGGIIIPELEKKAKRLLTGKIVAVGPGKEIEGRDGIYVKRMPFKVGEIVMYSEYAKGTIECENDLQEWHNVRAEDIVAVIK